MNICQYGVIALGIETGLQIITAIFFWLPVNQNGFMDDSYWRLMGVVHLGALGFVIIMILALGLLFCFVQLYLHAETHCPWGKKQ